MFYQLQPDAIKLSNILEGVLNDFSQFSPFACTFLKASSETYL